MQRKRGYDIGRGINNRDKDEKQVSSKLDQHCNNCDLLNAEMFYYMPVFKHHNTVIKSKLLLFI